MDEEIYNKYKLAGKIAAEARDYGINLIKPDLSFLELANSVESKIIDLGAEIAFPVNISINEIAAHYSPRHDDKLVIKKGDVVKLDVGAHIDGYIADTAKTTEVETNNYSDMIKASEEALSAAIELMKADVNLTEIGKKVQDTINSFGFKPISNLTGHKLEKYCLHSGLSIPSVPDMLHKTKPKVDDAIAIEPFATDGAGHVTSGDGSNIYLCNESIRSRFVRDHKSKKLYSILKNNFSSLPFAQRWSEKIFTNSDTALRKLAFHGLVKHYPQLIDLKKGIVTQKEHTVIVNEDGCEVIT